MDQEFARYQRQVILPCIGEDGQRRIRSGHVAIVGMGALGCAGADLLARAGVGRLTIIDRDLVEWTNLQRQTLFVESDARDSLPKAEAAAARLTSINAQLTCVPQVTDLAAENAERLLGLSSNESAARPHVLFDGTDNFETRFLLNDISVKCAIPFVYGGVIATRGMHAAFIPGRGPCMRCVFEAPPAPGSTPTCDTAGVLGSVVSAVAAGQVVDVLKVLTGQLGHLSPSLTEFDVWNGHHRVIDLAGQGPRVDCPACGLRRFQFLDEGLASGDTAALCGQNAVQVRAASDAGLSLEQMETRLAHLGDVRRTRFMLRFAPREHPGVQLSIFTDGRAIVHGTTRPELARSLYARFIGA